MSYKFTLQEHNTKLQQAIDKAKELPDASSGDSSDVIETCTLRFECEEEMTFVDSLYYPTINENGDVIWEKYHPEQTETTITIENVVVNQFIQFGCDITDKALIETDHRGGAIPSYDAFAKQLTDDPEFGYYYFICTEASATSLVRITLYEW